MKLLFFLLLMSVSVPVLARSSQFTQLVAGEVSLQRYLHECLAPIFRRYVIVAGEAAGIEAGVVEKILITMAAANALVPEAWVIDGVMKLEENVEDDFLAEKMGRYDPLGRSYGSEDVENMIGGIEEFMRDKKIVTFIDVHDDIVVSTHSNEADISPLEVAQLLDIDRESAEKFVRATSILTKQDLLFTLHLIGAIAEPELIASTRLLLQEYQDLIEPNLRKELSEALELDSYPAGFFGDKVSIQLSPL